MRRWISSLRLKTRTLLRRDDVEVELREEFAFHIEQKARELVERGYDEDEAREIAMRAMKMEREMEKCRDERAWQGWERLRADVVFGWRQLRKRKVTTAAAVISLALAFGSCMAAFRLVDTLYLRPLPVSDPGNLYVAKFTAMHQVGKVSTSDYSSYPMFQQMRDAVKGQATLTAIGYTSPTDVTYGGYQQMEKAYLQPVSGEMFGMMGLKPVLGRLIGMEDDRVPKQSAVAVLSYEYWQRRFGGDAHVIGRRFRRDDDEFEIVGVAPKGFTGTELGLMADLFTPTMMQAYATDKNDQDLEVLVRPLPGTALAALTSTLDAVYQRSEKERAKGFDDLPEELLMNWPNGHLHLQPLGSGESGLKDGYRTPLWALSIVVGLVLLIACANVANLMSAQSAARVREMAVRVSLGAGRRRLVRMVLVESAMLGAAAGALGLGFAWWAAPFVVGRMTPPEWPIRLALPMDWEVAAFGLGLMMVVMLLFGLLPALRASRVQPARALKGDEEPRTQRGVMHGLIAVQVAFCFVVLFVAGLFTATFAKLAEKPVGFVPERLLVLETTAQQKLPMARWDAVVDAVRGVPGVQRAAMGDRTLMGGMSHDENVVVDGVAHKEQTVYFMKMSPGWIATMGVPLIEGRDINSSDMSENAALVNEAFVKTYFPGKDPVGRTFMLLDSQAAITIAGVVGDAAYHGIHEPMPAQVYQPMRMGDGKGGWKTVQQASLLVQTRSNDPLALAETLSKTIAQTDGTMRVSKVRSQRQIVEGATVLERMLATLGGFFAVVALLLAAIGLYGVLHYSVVQRERELGIRIALGAAAGNIARVVTVRVMLMVLLGAGVGLGAGLASVRFVSSLLYGVRGTEVSMMVLPAVVLLAAVGLAALPAVLRAVRIDPVRMLRAE